MATETTLMEELESAAAALHAYASWLGSQGSGDGMRDMVADAGRLRARAERVRELDELWRTDSGHWSAERSAAHALLCGPLPPPASPSGMKGRDRT